LWFNAIFHVPALNARMVRKNFLPNLAKRSIVSLDKEPKLKKKSRLGGVFKYFRNFHPENGGNSIQFDDCIFFRWVGSTTN